MDYEEFVKIVEESVDGLDYNYDGDAFYIQEGFVIQKHEEGGASGGNCYGDFAKRYHNSKDMEPFAPLDAILRAAKPNITYLEYKEVEALIVEDSVSDYEYYGNYTEYTILKLDIEKLYNKLFG